MGTCEAQVDGRPGPIAFKLQTPGALDQDIRL
jgi:hypothetical protein